MFTVSQEEILEAFKALLNVFLYAAVRYGRVQPQIIQAQITVVAPRRDNSHGAFGDLVYHYHVGTLSSITQWF